MLIIVVVIVDRVVDSVWFWCSCFMNGVLRKIQVK